MPTVDLRQDDLRWPARCCPCAGVHVDEGSGTIRLRLFNDTVAAELRRRSLPGH